MAYPPQYIAMVVGAVRTLVGTENIHLRDAIARVARQMNLDAALVDSWVKQSPEYTAREDAPGAARRSGTSANKRSAEHEQGVKAREKANASPFPRAAVKRAYGVSDRGAKVTGIRPHTSSRMGCPATAEPSLSQPQPYARRRVYSLAVLPAAFTPATPSVLHPKYCTIHCPGRGPSYPPRLGVPFSTLPFLSFEEVLCLLHSLHQPPASPHHRVSALF